MGELRPGFTELLSKLVKKSGVTQSQIALLLGVSPGYVSQILKGQRKRLKPELVYGLADILKAEKDERIRLFEASSINSGEYEEHMMPSGFSYDERVFFEKAFLRLQKAVIDLKVSFVFKITIIRNIESVIHRIESKITNAEKVHPNFTENLENTILEESVEASGLISRIQRKPK